MELGGVAAGSGLNVGPRQKHPESVETVVRVSNEKRAWQSGFRCCFGSGPRRKMFDPVGPN